MADSKMRALRPMAGAPPMPWLVMLDGLPLVRVPTLCDACGVLVALREALGLGADVRRTWIVSHGV